ncbi:MAG: YhcN/YlaJ family sporulation lipoprotein [Defluviitaleaceae bacterium]|nr:YhcN/YlaJ family sporulation lipoprotein [Defluviitaleaceae bacterium]
MRRILSVTVVLSVLLTGCSLNSGDVANFERQQNAEDNTGMSIAAYLSDFDEIEDCTVQVDGGVAVVSMSLAEKYSDTELIALKRRVVADIRRQYDHINHVSVNTLPDLFENFVNPDATESPEEKEIDRQLEKNADKEIFNNVAPSA